MEVGSCAPKVLGHKAHDHLYNIYKALAFSMYVYHELFLSLLRLLLEDQVRKGGRVSTISLPTGFFYV